VSINIVLIAVADAVIGRRAITSKVASASTLMQCIRRRRHGGSPPRSRRRAGACRHRQTGTGLEMTVFGRRLAAASCVLAMIAVLWQALPAILVPACT
jgi:hypothetical protein